MVRLSCFPLHEVFSRIGIAGCTQSRLKVVFQVSCRFLMDCARRFRQMEKRLPTFRSPNGFKPGRTIAAVRARESGSMMSQITRS